MANKVEARIAIPKFGAFRLNLLSMLQFTGQSGLLMAATALASVIAYLLQVLLARGLSVREFGTFGALQSLIYIVAVPVGTLSTIAAHFIADYRVSRSPGAISAFIRGLRRHLLPLGLGLALAVVLGAPWLASILNLPSPWLIVIGGGAIVTFGALSVERGGLLGLELVGHLSLNTVLEAVARFVLCVGVLWLGRGLPWVWLGWGGAYLVALLAAWPAMRRASNSPAAGEFDRAAVWRYTLPVIAGTGLLALMMHADMVFVSAFFSRQMAGAYAATLVYARASLLPAMAIAPLTLSVATAQHQQGKATADVLGLSLLLAAMPAALATLAALLIPDFLVNLLFGVSYAAAHPLLAPLSLVYGLMALLFVYVRYSLAIGNYRFLKVLAAGALLEMGAFGLFHQQLTDIIWILLVMQIIMVLVFGIRFWINLWRIRPDRILKQSDGLNDQR
jgi:O-antigen/teichoic acid export membrane protein